MLYLILSIIIFVFIALCYHFKIFTIRWSVVIAFVRVLIKMRVHTRNNKDRPFSFVDIFESKVDDNPKRVQFITVEDNKSYTLDDVDRLSNQVANWGVSLGLQQKDTVAIMLLNHPDYVSLWLGFSKIGVSSALINTNTSGAALIHSCDVALINSDIKVLIVDNELRNQIKDDISKLKGLEIQVFYWNSMDELDFFSVKSEVNKFSHQRLDSSYRNQIMERDALLYIFTSGTTGMPKACKINQTRFFVGGLPFVYGCKMTANERIYAVLPMYHSAIGIICISAGIHSGASVVLRRKFSASQFSSDCIKFNITYFQYIGELCRYLVASPTNTSDQIMKLKCAYGNGLRPEIWNKFIEKYHVQQIVEFYGATEGNVFMFNPVGKVGALGYLPRILDTVYPTCLVKTCPEDPSIPYRNSNTGKCVKCKPNEVGMLICEIKQSGERVFEGYSDKKATESKILKNVFKDDDRYFNTGDLLSRDEEGFFYWSDRTGDTFRWKGENVATTEVATVLSGIKSIKDVTVYGVTVPDCDGRAGMAVVIPTEDSITISDLIIEIRSICNLNLPMYSWPLFLRVKQSNSVLLTTSTFKHIKTDLVKEGFDPTLVDQDVLYYHNTKSNSYEVLDKRIFNEIMTGKMRF